MAIHASMTPNVALPGALNGDQITVKDNDTTTGVRLIVGGKTIPLKDGAAGFASFPASISLGGVSVEIRRGKAFQLIFEARASSSTEGGSCEPSTRPKPTRAGPSILC